jgi:hypothetical protein
MMRHRAHAYLFEGEDGAQAAALAKAINCLHPGDDACNKCSSCRLFESGNHPDILYVTGSKPTSIGVDDVRDQIIHQMATAPFSHRYKIFVINDAHMLTIPAQNALLKIIEEPAPYGVFLLTCQALEMMLETVRSRCSTPAAPAVGNTPVAGNTTASSATAPSTPAVSIKGHEKGNSNFSEPLHLITTQAHKADILGALSLYEQFKPFKENKQELHAFLDELYAEYGQILRKSHADYAVRGANAIARAKEALSQNGNFQLTIELLLLEIANHLKEGAA